MIQIRDSLYILETEHTSYLFRRTPSGHLEHLYYGKRIHVYDEKTLMEKYAFLPGNAIAYSEEYPNFTLENISLEMSAYGKGDLREPFVEIVHEDGSLTCDYLYAKDLVDECKEDCGELPGSYDESGKTEHLCVTLKDRSYESLLELHYYVYPECDVITRKAVLMNTGTGTHRINRLMSLQLDFQDEELCMTTFHGNWAREMHRMDCSLKQGKYVNDSYTGTSSNRANPFVMLSREKTTEDSGWVYGINLIYSGNHYACAEVTSFGKTRYVCGINPRSFSWKLEPGERFESPEAVMCFSAEGYNGMSTMMHAFVKKHIVRGEWKEKTRPVLLNSWEAAYFNFDEKKLLKLARQGKEVGIELFVMDDGWFGKRNDDTCSLGDWQVNQKKLPGGVKGLCEKIKDLGMSFGLWVEPEMVNVDSDFYRAHPDWTLEIPGKKHSEGRNQRILDLTNPAVQDSLIESMTNVFSQADISYVKWDMNRNVSDCYSGHLPAEQQGEVFHRYVLGLYRCLRELTGRFPHILFEGCSAGGNRFDLGMLCYFPQIWGSDNTDALCRAEMQTNYSYGYPLSVVGSHVSAVPNHQTLRSTHLETRFAVAAFGSLGYECNLCDFKKEELYAIRAQIALYKEWSQVFRNGTFYRGRGFYTGTEGGAYSSLWKSGGNCIEWICVSEDREKAVGMQFQRTAIPNMPYESFFAHGLEESYLYHFTNRSLKYSIKDFGDLVNTVSPIHIRQDSMLQNLLDRFVKMDGEKEDCIAYGDELMYHGVKLKPAFGATGYSDEVRYSPDYTARMYFMERIVQ